MTVIHWCLDACLAIRFAPLVMLGEVQKPLLKEASIHRINFAIVKIICKICIINIIKSLVGKTSDMTSEGQLRESRALKPQ